MRISEEYARKLIDVAEAARETVDMVDRYILPADRYMYGRDQLRRALAILDDEETEWVTSTAALDEGGE